MSTRSFRSGSTHVLALSLTLTMCGFYQYYIYFKFKIVLYFLVWNICGGRSLNKLNTYCIFHIYPYILLILACVFGGCLLWWGKAVIPVDTQRVHHFSTAGGMMNQVYLQELQSGPSSVASSIHSMLGWVTPLWYYCTITTKGFTSQSSLLFPATFTLCFDKSSF